MRLARFFDDTRNTLGELSRSDWIFAICLIYCGALLSAKYLLSLCTFALLLITLFDLRVRPFRVGFNPDLKNLGGRIRERPDLFAISIVFFLYLLFSLHEFELNAFLDQLRRKLSFLIWPFVFLMVRPFSRRRYLMIYYFLMVNVVVSAIMVLWIYYTNTYLFDRVLGYGLALPTPMFHIRYSMLVSLAILGGIVMFREGFFIRWKWERYAVAALAAGLFVYQHILAVRTGLVLTYLGIFILVAVHVIRSWSVPAVLAILAGTFLLPVFAYHTFPTFKRKVDYTVFDLKKYQSGEGAGYSVADRLRSLQTGLDIVSETPVFGLGFPNVKGRVIDYYKTSFNTEAYFTPNNQYISVYSGSGVVGLTIFVFALLFPLFYGQNAQDPLFLVIYTVFLASMFVESTLGNYFGSTMYLLFSVFGLSQLGHGRPAGIDQPLDQA